MFAILQTQDLTSFRDGPGTGFEPETLDVSSRLAAATLKRQPNMSALLVF